MAETIKQTIYGAMNGSVLAVALRLTL
jgi:hypothetical protein